MLTIYNYLSLIKFSHTIFAMPFAIIGYFTAIYSRGYEFDITTLMLVILCMVFARNAAMGFNRYIDRKYDALNPRTADREIPGKIISPKNALIFVVANSVAFIIVTWFINLLCFALSPVALIVVLGYSFTKRFTWLSHIILGIGLSLSPVGAYIAVTGSFDLTIILYALTVLFWVAGFDILYSINDSEFDKKHNLYSIPAVFGKNKSNSISIIFHLFSALFLIFVALTENFGLISWIATMIFISLLIIQHIITLVKKNFMNSTFVLTNGLASIFLSVGLLVEMIIIYY